MKTILANDRISSRDLRHKNLLLCPNMGIVEFRGEDIPPVLRVLKRDYTKEGKWSHTTWTVEVQEDFQLLSFRQDWGTGEYFPVRTWRGAIEHLNNKLDGMPSKLGIPDEAIVRAIRAIFPKSAAEIDAAEEKFSSAGNVLAELLSAQAELAAAKSEEACLIEEVSQLDEADRIRKEAEDTRARVAKARELLKSGQRLSLADLAALRS